MSKETVSKSSIRKLLQKNKDALIAATRVELRADITTSSEVVKVATKGVKKSQVGKPAVVYVGQVYVCLNKGVTQQPDATGAIPLHAKTKQIYIAKVKRFRYAELKSVLSTTMRNTREVVGEMNRVFDPVSPSTPGEALSAAGRSLTETTCEDISVPSKELGVADDVAAPDEQSSQLDYTFDETTLWSDVSDVLGAIRNDVGVSNVTQDTDKNGVKYGTAQSESGASAQVSQVVELYDRDVDVLGDVGLEVAKQRAMFPVELPVGVTDGYLWKVGALSFEFAKLSARVCEVYSTISVYMGRNDHAEIVDKMPGGALNNRLEMLAMDTRDLSLMRYVAKFAAEFELLVGVRNEVVHSSSGLPEEDALDKTLWLIPRCYARLDDVELRLNVLLDSKRAKALNKSARKQLRKQAAKLKQEQRDSAT